MMNYDLRSGRTRRQILAFIRSWGSGRLGFEIGAIDDAMVDLLGL